MAKKTVATLQTGGGKQHTKVIKMVRSEKTGAYTFREEVVHNDKVKEWLASDRVRAHALKWAEHRRRRPFFYPLTSVPHEFFQAHIFE